MRTECWITGIGANLGRGDGGVQMVASALDLPVIGSGTKRSRVPEPRHLDGTAAWFFDAAVEAWASAGLLDDEVNRERVAVVEGSSLGPLGAAIDAASGSGRPTDLIRCQPGAGGMATALALGLRGRVACLTAGSVSSAWAIADAIDLVARGECDVAIAGGGECPDHPAIARAFALAGIASDDPSERCRPFDRDRRYTRLGRGAGAVIVESVAHARGRGARPLAVVLGVGTATEGYGMVNPDPGGTGVTNAICRAMSPGRLGEIGWIKAHATGTRAGDAAEARGIAAAFGEALAPPITAFKPRLGHSLGASGAVETVGAVLALRAGQVPHVVGTDVVDPALPTIDVVRHEPRSVRGPVLVLTEGFGGRTAALALQSG